MKKLKFGLILAFSMTLALGLTACSNADEYTIERIRYSGDASITLTDAETSEEESALEAFNEKVAETRLRVYADGSLMRNIISGADCEYDTSSVVWGEVGSYSVTVTPKENNANALTTTLTVTIEHQFGDPDPATGVARCTHCGKVESNTTFATPVTVNYGAFHGGYTSDSTQDPDGLVKPFGTVAGSTGGNVEVGTYSVGKLRKGMTLSVTGTAQSVGTGEDSWYYPILGIAMREFDPATVGSPYSTGEYASGASVLVRNDGWVLLNGIGDPNRLLAGFAGGSGETYNYSSVTGGSTAPANYQAGTVPTSTAAEDWPAWYVYSSGTQLYKEDYAEAQDVTFTWQFREDNVIVVTNRNNTTGTSLVSYIRVPDSMGDYTFDTVLHGEFVNMTFASISAVQSDLLSSVTAQLASDAKRTYVEGETLDLDELSVRIAFESAPAAYEFTTDYTLQAYIGSATTAEAAQADIAPESWTEVTADTPLSSVWQFFRVRSSVGGLSRYSYLNVGYSNFLSEIAPNSVEAVTSSRITLNGFAYQNQIENMLAYGELVYGAGTSAENGTTVAVAPTGVPDAIPANANAGEGYTHFMAFRLFAKDGAKFGTPSANQANVTVRRADDGSFVDVLVFLNAEIVAQNNIVITGMQTTPVRVDLTGVTIPSVSSAITDGVDAQGSVPVNVGGDVTVEYMIPGLTVDAFNANRNAVILAVGSATASMGMSGTNGFNWTGNSFANTSGVALGNSTVTMSGSVADQDGGMKLTVTYHVPALPNLSEQHPGYAALRMTYNGVTVTDTVYYGAPVERGGASGFILDIDGVRVWVNAVGATVYYAVVGSGDNVVDSSVDVPSFVINTNAGANTPATMYAYLNVGTGLGMADGEVSCLDAASEKNAAFTGSLRVLGTANDAKDYDRGWLVTGAVNAGSYGVTLGTGNGAQTVYYFEVVANGVSHLYKVTYTAQKINFENNQLLGIEPAKTEVKEYSLTSETEKTSVTEHECDTFGVTARAVENGAFWYDVSVATHEWEAVDGSHVLFACKTCGVVLNSTGVSVTGSGDNVPDNGTEVDETLLGDKLAESGMSVSFFLNSASSDWDNVVLATVAGNIQITMPNLQVNVKTTKPASVDQELWDAAAGGDNNMLPAANAEMAEGAAWDTLILSSNSYVTVVVKPGENRETDGGLYYVNGELLYHYAARTRVSGFTVAQFTELFLRCAQESGVYVNGAKYAGGTLSTTDMLVESRALTAEQVVTRYNNYLAENGDYPHNHTWGAESRCTSCGILNPDHTHVYVNGVCTVSGCGMVDPHHEHVYSSALEATYDHCTICGEINPLHGKTGLGGQKHVYDETLHCYACDQLDPHHTAHDFSNGNCVCGEVCKHNFVDGVCTICGASWREVTVDQTFNNPTVWVWNYDLPVNVGRGDNAHTAVIVKGSMDSPVAETYHTMIWEIKEGITGCYDGRAWSFGSGTSNFTAIGNGVKSILQPDGTATSYSDAVYRAIVAKCDWTLEFNWDDASNLKVVLNMTATEGSYIGYTFNTTYNFPVNTASAVTSVSIHFCAEAVNSYTISSYSYIALPSD